jgi:DNA-binding transcriptional ArsR family regulator
MILSVLSDPTRLEIVEFLGGVLREVDAMALDQISELKKAEEMLEASI